MRHAFADRYQTDDGPRIRCSRCGVGSHWPGARDECNPKLAAPVRAAVVHLTDAKRSGLACGLMFRTADMARRPATTVAARVSCPTCRVAMHRAEAAE